MKFTRVSERAPSLRALARASNLTHQCVDEMRADLGRLAETVDGHGRSIEEIKDALGVGKVKRRTLATMGPAAALAQGALAFAGGMGALLLSYRLAVSLWPAFVAFLAAVNRAVLAQ